MLKLPSKCIYLLNSDKNKFLLLKIKKNDRQTCFSSPCAELWIQKNN